VTPAAGNRAPCRSSPREKGEEISFEEGWEQRDRREKGAVGISVVTNGMSGDLFRLRIRRERR
jgi:hypothetical protein